MKKMGGLGRGLDALLESGETSPSPMTTARLDELAPNRFQPRADFDDAGLAELAESIRQQGVVQPIVVSRIPEGGYTIIAGERRWRAARLAGLGRVPIVVRELSDDRQMLEMALVENLQRADLNPIEEAEAYRSLRDNFGSSQEEIGLRVGKSRAAVSNALRLLGLPEEIQDMVRAGQLSAGQARPLLSVEDRERQIALAARAHSEGLTARQLEELTSRSRKRREPRRAPALDPDTRAAAERLTRSLQTKVEIRRRGAGGTVQIHFHNEEELMRLYERLLPAPRSGE